VRGKRILQREYKGGSFVKKYKVIVLDRNGNEKPLGKKKNDEHLLEINFKSEKSRIYYYENMKLKYPDCSIKMMMCQ
jgi:hypothetical protein